MLTLKRGEVARSHDGEGKTFYVITGYTEQPDGSVRAFTQGAQGFHGLIRGSFARRILRQLHSRELLNTDNFSVVVHDRPINEVLG